MSDRRVEYGMPFERYSDERGVANSSITKVLQSPYHYWAANINPDRPPHKPSPAMLAGTLAHTMILERDKFAERYVVRPDGLKLNTKDGKAWAESVPAGVTIIDSDDYGNAEQQMRAVFDQQPDIAAMIYAAGSQVEVSAFWTDHETGLACKCRPDVVAVTGGKAVLIDIKTARSVTPRDFSRSICDFGYHRQAAWYSRGFEAASGIEVAQFVFLVVTSAYPFVAAAYVLDDDSLQQGSDECDAALQLLVECRRDNEWPTHMSGVQTIGLPPYARASSEVEVSYV